MSLADTAAALKSNYLTVDGTRIHYFEQGQGDPVIFLHGWPTSAWLWRKVIPHVSSLSRCIALDLAGFGQSGQPDTAYTLADQVRFLNGLIDSLHLERITFVLHGWGGIVGLAVAMQQEKRCRGLVFYETWLQPVTGEHVSLPWQDMLASLAQADAQHTMATKPLPFIESALRHLALRPLSDSAMTHYCAPFSLNGSGQSFAHCLAEAPRGDGKSPADSLLASAGSQLEASSLPKLLLYSVPGFLMTMATIEWAKQHLRGLEVFDIGEELHFAQESRPEQMGEVISAWLQGIEQSSQSKG